MCEPALLSPTCRLGLEPMLPLYNFRTNKKLLFNLYTVPMLIKLELKTTLVLGLYKLGVLAIVRLLSSSQILFPPPPPQIHECPVITRERVDYLTD